MCIIEFAIIFDSFAKTIIITIVTKSSLVSPSDCQIFNKDSIIIKDFETCLILFVYVFFSSGYITSSLYFSVGVLCVSGSCCLCPSGNRGHQPRSGGGCHFLWRFPIFHSLNRTYRSM